MALVNAGPKKKKTETKKKKSKKMSLLNPPKGPMRKLIKKFFPTASVSKTLLKTLVQMQMDLIAKVLDVTRSFASTMRNTTATSISSTDMEAAIKMVLNDVTMKDGGSFKMFENLEKPVFKVIDAGNLTRDAKKDKMTSKYDGDKYDKMNAMILKRLNRAEDAYGRAKKTGRSGVKKSAPSTDQLFYIKLATLKRLCKLMVGKVRTSSKGLMKLAAFLEYCFTEVLQLIGIVRQNLGVEENARLSTSHLATGLRIDSTLNYLYGTKTMTAVEAMGFVIKSGLKNRDMVNYWDEKAGKYVSTKKVHKALKEKKNTRTNKQFFDEDDGKYNHQHTYQYLTTEEEPN